MRCGRHGGYPVRSSGLEAWKVHQDIGNLSVQIDSRKEVGVDEMGLDLQANECQKEGVPAEEVEDYESQDE